MAKFCILFLLILGTTSAWAYELMTIQAVSSSKQTFITRNGKRHGVNIGMTGTFTADDVSILAKAIQVTGNFTQWEIINRNTTLPFEKGNIVTYYPATEYIWALSPEAERKKFIRSEIIKPRRAWLFKGALTRGLNESVSDASATITRRGGFLGEVYFEQGFMNNLSYDLGLRYEREVVSYTGASYITKRSLFIADINYYFDFLREYLAGRFFVGVGAGYGLSNTETVGLKQSGPAALLPAIKLGMSLPFNDKWEFITDASFESLSTREEQEDGNHQTTTQTNFKFGFGLKKFF